MVALSDTASTGVSRTWCVISLELEKSVVVCSTEMRTVFFLGQQMRMIEMH